MSTDMEQVPGFLFFDHVAISVKPGELESNVKAYEAMGCFCGPRPLTQRRTRLEHNFDCRGSGGPAERG
jgi:hypothetical protein